MNESQSLKMLCPKCAGVMRSYERSGVVIDQCGDCRGVYLDRGELERLITAEELAYAKPPSENSARDYSANYSDRSGSGHGGSKHDSNSGHKKRRGGFLGELFD